MRTQSPPLPAGFLLLLHPDIMPYDMRMNSKQFTSALAQLGATRAAFTKVIKVNDRTVRRWASGETPVPTHIAMLLNLMLDTDTDISDLRA